MGKLESLVLLDTKSNNEYKLKVTPEIYARASSDPVFAEFILNQRIDHDVEVLDMPLEDLLKRAVKADICSQSHLTAEGNDEHCYFSTSPTKDKSDVYNWTRSEVFLLLSTYKDNLSLFTDNNMSKYEAWEKVNQSMSALRAQEGLPQIDAKKCKTKMDALRRHYKKIKSSLKPGAQITWPYYEEMDELLSDTKQESKAVIITVKSADGSDGKTSLKRKRTIVDLWEEAAKERKMRAKIRSQEHKERIEAINKLTDAVCRLVDKIGKKH